MVGTGIMGSTGSEHASATPGIAQMTQGSQEAMPEAQTTGESCAPPSQTVRLVRSFSFEAAHLLPKTPPGHKCRRLHGHSFRVELVCEGEIDQQTGWLLDFADIKRAFAPIKDQLDHHYLNEVPGLENPTAENIARWIWIRIKKTLSELTQVNVAETCTARCEYRG